MKTKGKSPTSRSDSKDAGLIQRSVHAVKRLFSRSPQKPPVSAAPKPRPFVPEPSAPTRLVQRQTDVPMDVLDRAYTPSAMSSKASFRSDGSDHQQGQEFADDIDIRFNDEDRYTNKSGDPRIGTHGRTYEPAEARDESRQQ